MSDPVLFDLLHGVQPSKKKSRLSSLQESKAKDPSALALDQAVNEHVDALLAADDQPEDKLLTPALRRAKVEQEVRDAASFTEFGKNLSLGVKILRSEGKEYLEEEENTTLQNALDGIVEQIDTFNLSELNEASLQAALKLDATLGRFILKIGIEKFSKGQQAESLGIFLLLTLVNPEEPDYWFRFGLVAKECEQYRMALNALATTSELAPAFIGAYIYSAYCHLKLGAKESAMVELAEAKKILENSAVEEHWRQHVVDIEELIATASTT
jgi:tetratricopeptide (TPR) repeat protein